MPTARDSIEIEIEFEMYCAVCGDGICHNTVYRRGTRNKFETQCDECNKKRQELESELAAERGEAREMAETIEQKNTKIDELNETIELLRSRVDKLESLTRE